VNLLVDNSERRRPPVIVENHPSYKNLFGSIERSHEAGIDPSADHTRTLSQHYL
jgi:predicted ATP-dependent protease